MPHAAAYLARHRAVETDPPTYVSNGKVTRAGIVKGTRSLAFAQVTTQVLRFGTNIALARLLDPRAFGLVAIATLVTMFLEPLKDLGTGAAIIQRKDLSGPVINVVFLVNVTLGILLSAIMFFSAGWLADVFNSTDAHHVLQIFALAPFASCFGQVHQALLRRDMRFQALAIMSVIVTVLVSVLSIGLALLGFGSTALIIGALSGYIVTSLLAWILDPWRPWHSGWRADREELIDVGRYSGHLFGASVLNFFFNESDKVLVSRWLGTVSLGIYTMVQRILYYPIYSISNVVTEVAFSTFSRLQDQNARLRKGMIRAARAVAAISFPLMAGLAAVARPAVDGVLGPAWHDLTPLIWIMAPAGAVQAVTFVTLQLLLAKGRSDLYFRWTIVSTGVTVAAYVIGLHWGLVGICSAFAIALLALVPLCLRLSLGQIDLPARVFLAALRPFFLLSVVMVLGVLMVDRVAAIALSDPAVLGVGVATGIVIYVGGLFLFEPAMVVDLLTTAGVLKGNATGMNGKLLRRSVNSYRGSP